MLNSKIASKFESSVFVNNLNNCIKNNIEKMIKDEIVEDKTAKFEKHSNFSGLRFDGCATGLVYLYLPIQLNDKVVKMFTKNKNLSQSNMIYFRHELCNIIAGNIIAEICNEKIDLNLNPIHVRTPYDGNKNKYLIAEHFIYEYQKEKIQVVFLINDKK